MKAVTIHDTGPGGVLSFDLADVLRVVGRRSRGSTWHCRNVECFGESADVLHGWADTDAPIPDAALLDTIRGVYQVIDGDFFASSPADASPWLVVRAIDSSLYVVASEDEAVLSDLRAHFRDVRDSPEDSVGTWDYGPRSAP